MGGCERRTHPTTCFSLAGLSIIGPIITRKAVSGEGSSPMEMILLDWTRMGHTYCLAGVVAEAGGYRVVRPLPSRQRNSPQRNVGWSPFMLEGHGRGEILVL